MMHEDEKAELLRINALLSDQYNALLADRDRWRAAPEAGKRTLDGLRETLASALRILG